MGAAAVSGVAPSGAGDGDDAWPLPPHRGGARRGWERGGVVDAERDLVFFCLPEQRAIWDRAAAYVEEHLLQHKVVQRRRPPDPLGGVGRPPLPHGVAYAYSKTWKLAPKSKIPPPMDKKGLGEGGITSGRWSWTSGLETPPDAQVS